jgi:hypothetical protein
MLQEHPFVFSCADFITSIIIKQAVHKKIGADGTKIHAVCSQPTTTILLFD